MYAFVDGAVDINQRRDQGGAGFGGAGVVLVQTAGDHITTYRVIGVPFWPHSIFITNNTMEVMAAKIAADLRDHKEDLHIWSDSQYVKNMLAFGSNYTAMQNKDLIAYARWSVARDGVYIHHCRGHAGFAWNELANLAAQQAVKNKRGFDRAYGCAIGRLCFRCKKFPCDIRDDKFGLKTAELRQRYADIVECDQYEYCQVEGLSHE